MALPPGFLDELRARLTLSDVVGRKVVWDRRKSQPSKGDWWAPCPFHQEKTPSFHVDDRKGFYYCFGCQQKGDAITFVKETENLSFIEAVERLASEAGLEMPQERADPRAREKRDRAARLADVMEQAVAAFRRAFRSGGGAKAREYAAGRGLSEETLAAFEIGYAPAERGFLTGVFRDKGLMEEAVAAGLVRVPEDGGGAYDQFFDRLIFPIRDGRGRCIAFGGRALSPNAKAKYVNSPQTVLFDKSRTLYNEGPAREAAGRSGQLVVAEGYMDVIALAAGGIGHAVAPLGTAITAEQLALMWRIAPEPVIALDGDAAGLRAAWRLIDLALPELGPGRSLGFCLMPEGQDPDDLMRTGGRAAVESAVADAVPLVEMLWRRETAAHPLDTPERRSALKARLDAAVGTIADRTVRGFYAHALDRRARDLFWRLDRPVRAEAPQRQGSRGQPSRGPGARGQRPGWPGRGIVPGASETARRSALARALPPGEARDAATRAREAQILLVALANPDAAAAVEAALEDLPLATPQHEAIRDGLLAAMAAGTAAGAEIARRGIADPAAFLRTEPLARAHPFSEGGRDPATAARVLAEAIARHAAQRMRETERDLGVESADGAGDGDEGLALALRLRQVVERCLAVEESAERGLDRAEEGPEDSPIAAMLSRHSGKKSGTPP